MSENIWGKLASRYDGQEKQPHRILSVDGGGILGVISLVVLQRLEELLADRGKEKIRLCDFFDYIGGTSTGAIIAAGLARGMTASEILQFYREAGPAMFEKQWLWNRAKASYKSDPLQNKLEEIFGSQTTLHPDQLECLLLVVTRNRTTDSPWPISSNPKAKYNQLSRSDCNLHIKLADLVRASTAAPVYFPPQALAWDKNDPTAKRFVFVDGGVTPYNSPAFLMYRMATAPEYNLNWASGEDKLLVVSMGTGYSAQTEDEIDNPSRNILQNAVSVPRALMSGIRNDQDTNCRTIGRCIHGHVLDRELGDMIPRDSSGNRTPLNENLGRLFLYARYDADVSREGLDALGLSHIDPKHVSKLDSIEYIDELLEVGKKVASRLDLADFGPFV